jgi:site-specific DNA-methyltransferase (adenine-specific)
MIIEQMLKNAPKPLLHIADVSGSALFHGDCLDIMPLIPDKSVQLILADLPYNMTANKWDCLIDINALWMQYERILKDDGCVLLFAIQPFATNLIISKRDWFKYDWILSKARYSRQTQAKRMPLLAHEYVLTFYKKQPKYKPYTNEKNMLAGKKTPPTKTENYLIPNQTEYVRPEFKTKNTLIPKYDVTERGLHPTQKSVNVLKFLIETYTDEQDMVLDNTMGSGTTCLAAKELNRKFIGIEKEANYYEIACRRCGF